MNDQRAPIVQQGSRARVRGTLLARGAWLVLVVFTLATYAANLPVFWVQLQTACVDTYTYGVRSSCVYLQPSFTQAAVLHGWGISLGAYAAVTLPVTLAMLVACLAVSALIVWRRPEDRMAMLVALMLVAFGAIPVSVNTRVTSPVWVADVSLLFLTGTLLSLVFLLFPSGRFVPRWSRWTVVAFVALQVPLQVPTVAVFDVLFPTGPVRGVLSYLVVIGELAILVVAQIYRYRWVSTPLERQQTKWVVVGFALPMTVVVGGTLLPVLVPALARSGSPFSASYQLAISIVGVGLLPSIPLAFGVAMQRYRLWDIDVLIRRALVYGTLIVILTAAYVGLVIGLQALLGRIGLIGQNNTVAVVLSTLAIAALFQPLRRRIQHAIGRRFYRRDYDVAKTLASFGATLRHETDLEQLRALVLAVVEETMQPAHASLWLQPFPVPFPPARGSGVRARSGSPSHFGGGG